MALQNAVIVRNAKKTYGDQVYILNGVNVTVPKGCIYSLLGASGCGKTTLLSCVVGVRKLDYGEIWVLGGQPGTKNSGIPGPRIGYMPQDVSLVGEFSVIDALIFFGTISGMEKFEIEERYIELKDLLQLPPRDRLVKNMSGGQQRRISFAAALLQKPELLILDEPTVGLDPVLRDNIWNHLVQITKQEGVTVIITTHYIEEAKQSDKIGLLRNGQLLAESSPNELLERFQTDSLEEAFLALSQQQTEDLQGNNMIPDTSGGINPIYNSYNVDNKQKQRIFQSNWKMRITALLYKNALQFLRHPGGFLFSIVLPVLEMMLFFHSIGPDPKSLEIYVVNEETDACNSQKYLGNITYYDEERTCKFIDLSCRFIANMDEDILKMKFYDNYEKAKEILEDNHDAVGILYFQRNFSFGMEQKLENMLTMSDDVISASIIDVELDIPDREIILFVKQYLYKIYVKEFEKIVEKCGINKKYANTPIKFEDPIYGKVEMDYSEYVTPVFLLTMLFVLATSVSSSAIITDRHSGIWDRVLVQGVTTAEILITHLITQAVIIIFQVAISLYIGFEQYDMYCEGSKIGVIAMGMLEGICGMLYGLFISVSCTSHSLANYASTGTFYPLLLLCGLLWPIEGMPKVLRWFSLTMPITVPGKSLREIMQKGTDFDEPEVFSGFLVVIVWILALTSICLFQLRYKS
ncbi:ABC transporter G family member 20 isoform X1 [Bombus terrestris]|uniref:ABC transporter G family member 20 isoform X1 n=2 Tax=Bombus terrestris TaxID=30195 RepID=A0A9B7CZT4_BOMTE|nr:ABC transporter G family member 20 isoform X1 [Bombus terrestris]XP_020722784.2 ABC transporter G family member 20 isoform X1 [Bombus terrestris]